MTTGIFGLLFGPVGTFYTGDKDEDIDSSTASSGARAKNGVNILEKK